MLIDTLLICLTMIICCLIFSKSLSKIVFNISVNNQIPNTPNTQNFSFKQEEDEKKTGMDLGDAIADLHLRRIDSDQIKETPLNFSEKSSKIKSDNTIDRLKELKELKRTDND